MLDAAAASSSHPADADFRKKIRKSHRLQKYGWIIFLIIVMGLLSVYSGGFFLYSALVVSFLFIVSVGVATVNLLGIDVNRSLATGEISLGQALDAWISIDNKKALPAFWLFWQEHVDPGLDVEGPVCHYKTLKPGGKQELKYRLHSTRRGLFRVGPVVIESSGPFGLARRFYVGESVKFVTVLPRVVPIGKGLAQGQRPIHQVPRRRSIFEDPSRFMGMRDYRPGDSMRRIHWRATARSGRLQVKLFEPSVLTGVLLAVDMGLASFPLSRKDPSKIDPLLEFSVTAAASLGEYVLTGDQSVGLISNGTDAADRFPDDWEGGSFRRLDDALAKTHLTAKTAAYQPVELSPAKGFWQHQRMLNTLARLWPSAGVQLPDLLMTELPKLPRSLVLMVVTPVMDGALCSVLESLKRSGIETGVIWTRLPEDRQTPPDVLPHNIPVYPVYTDADLEELGGRSL